MKQKTEDRVFFGILVVFGLFVVVSTIGRVALRRDCNAKGGVLIENECLRLERIK